MNTNATFERELERWLEVAAGTAAPAGIHAAVIAQARGRSQRPGFVANLVAHVPSDRVGVRRWPAARAMVALALVVAALIGIAIAAGALVQHPRPSWASVGSTLRYGNQVGVLLADERVLLVGPAVAVDATGAGLAPAEIFDPRTGTSTPTGPMVGPGTSTATLLDNGMVLVTGGRLQGPVVHPELPDAQLFDPATRSWSSTASPADPRSGQSAIGLHDGRVLLVGGRGRASLNGYWPPLAEIYDPGRGAWTTAGALLEPRSMQLAVLLADGRVLIAGGEGREGILSSAEVYDPALGTWSSTGSLTVARFWGATATLLADGRVLVAGGVVNPTLSPLEGEDTGSAELYDPASGRWAPAGSLRVSRYAATATLLPDGRVLVAGGNGIAGPLRSAEIFDPRSERWSDAPDMPMARADGVAVRLPGGLVLIAGGFTDGGDGPLSVLVFDSGT